MDVAPPSAVTETRRAVERIATFDLETLAGIVSLIDRARDQGRTEG